MSDILSLDRVSWGPPRHADIVKDVSLSIPRGQIAAICGANGAGKSTLLRLIYRFQRPRSGSVTLDGQDIWTISAQQTARTVAAVLQEQPTDFALSVRQIVALGRLPHRRGWGGAVSSPGIADAAVIEGALAKMDLTGMVDRRFATLSGGERQRVMVARALAQEPRLLVLDEPTNHLDIRHQLELLSLLRGLGLTVVTTLHDLGLAAEFADRVIVLHQGRILSDGPPDDALSEDYLATAFNVRCRIDRSGPHPRFSFHL
ncbi:ABC transporter ATP-binding protein [Rhizobium sp. LC145]|jgi:iron complex transport system ATP-binding protein|uniref:ABC transporter ATP-binding protein n=1 Tax=Rhizobium sp. LC145 TaxID=1120688 RepID=UPI00062A1D8B|nr:ABC transporter ATP-binding protein [Rhizobium sp. LC145]KKX25080.1 iron ABC transporter ATP-binding protein [Rhizobium sp. LC145]TKT55064.1 ABC transporter ATP-binding protein [Rhizobiaceae bacterium LC148]